MSYRDLNSVHGDGWNAALYTVRGGIVQDIQLLEDNVVNVKYESKTA
jgi:hypothetical protein